MAAVTPPGRVTLVGAGPGDPELLTLKAVRALREADVVLVDNLVNPAVLEHCRPGIRILDVGKRGGCRSTPQTLINRLLVTEARAGRRVVRLKGGDPCVFGRGGEELALLQRQGIEVRVVNGLSAGFVAPTSIGVPLTHRQLSQGAIFVTGHPREGGGEPDWARLAATGLTLVIYMGMQRLEAIVAALLAAELAPTLPVAVVEQASLPSQRALVAPLAEVARRARAADLRSPCVIVVGEVAGLAIPAMLGELPPAPSYRAAVAG